MKLQTQRSAELVEEGGRPFGQRSRWMALLPGPYVVLFGVFFLACNYNGDFDGEESPAGTQGQANPRAASGQNPANLSATFAPSPPNVAPVTGTSAPVIQINMKVLPACDLCPADGHEDLPPKPEDLPLAPPSSPSSFKTVVE